jgi:hypothetical protein
MKINEVIELSNRIRKLSHWIKRHNEFETEKPKLLENTDTDKLLYWSTLQQAENIAAKSYQGSYYRFRLTEAHLTIDHYKKLVSINNKIENNINNIDEDFYENIYVEGPYPKEDINELKNSIEELNAYLDELKQIGGIITENTNDESFINKIKKEVILIRNEITKLNTRRNTNFDLPNEFKPDSTTVTFS